MQELEKLVTQLDLAAEFLRAESPIRNRLALILVDNVVELLMHTRCVADSHDWLIKHGHKPEQEKKLHVALGEKFAPKLAYVHSIGKLTDDERQFLGKAHRLRNEAYHSGVMHEGVLHPIAWTYHDVACALLVRLHLRVVGHRSGEPIPPVLRRHAPRCDKPGDLVMNDTLRGIADSLASARGELEQPLASALSAAVLDTIGELLDSVAYMAKGSHFAATLDGFLRFLQMWSGPSNKAYVDAARLERWQERASAIASTAGEETPGRTMQRYMDLRTEMHNFEEDVRTALSTYDSMVDAMVDER